MCSDFRFYCNTLNLSLVLIKPLKVLHPKSFDVRCQFGTSDFPIKLVNRAKNARERKKLIWLTCCTLEYSFHYLFWEWMRFIHDPSRSSLAGWRSYSLPYLLSPALSDWESKWSVLFSAWCSFFTRLVSAGQSLPIVVVIGVTELKKWSLVIHC